MAAPASWIRIYRLVDAELISKNADLIARAVFGLRSSSDPGVRFAVAPGSGWIFYSDDNETWRNGRAVGELPTLQDAQVAATEFFSTANSRLAAERTLAQGGFRELFPTNPRRRGARLVTDPVTEGPSHWLCHFGHDLEPAQDEPRAPVLGALTDVRIGEGKKVEGVWHRWRAVTSEEVVGRVPSGQSGTGGGAAPTALQPASLIPLAERPGPLSIAPKGEEDETPTLAYLAADENVAQRCLVPYYVRGKGEDRTFSPASSHSFLPAISVNRSTGSVSLRADVAGGSGRYEFAWARWSPLTIGTAGIVDLGSGPGVEVDVGVSTIVLQVTDSLTGISVSTETVVY